MVTKTNIVNHFECYGLCSAFPLHHTYVWDLCKNIFTDVHASCILVPVFCLSVAACCLLPMGKMANKSLFPVIHHDGKPCPGFLELETTLLEEIQLILSGD